MLTIGGGLVLDPQPTKRKRFKEKGLSELKVLESGSTAEVVAQKVARVIDRLHTREDVLKYFPRAEVEAAVDALIAEEIVVELRADDVEYLVHRDTIKYLNEKLTKILEEYHRKFPLRSGMPREELRSRLFPANTRVFAALLLALQVEQPLRTTARTVALESFAVKFSGKWQRASETALMLFQNQAYSPPAPEDIAEATRLSSDDVRELLEALAEMQELIKVAEGMYFLRAAVCKAKDMILVHFEGESELTLATFRTLIDSSRKFALPLLEYFDHKKLTLRAGESRKRNSTFDSANLPC